MSEFFCTSAKETHVCLRQLCQGQSPPQQYGSELCCYPQTFHSGSKHCIWTSHCLLWPWSHRGRKALGRGDMLMMHRRTVKSMEVQYMDGTIILPISVSSFWNFHDVSFLVIWSQSQVGLIPNFLLSHWCEISFFFSSPQQWKKEEWFTHEKKKMFKSSLLFAIMSAESLHMTLSPFSRCLEVND